MGAVKLQPVYRNIRHEILFGGYKLGETYVTRWGWYLRTDYKQGPRGGRRRFPTKEAAAETVVKEARGHE